MKGMKHKCTICGKEQATRPGEICGPCFISNQSTCLANFKRNRQAMSLPATAIQLEQKLG